MEPSQGQIETLKSLFVESQIRGRHQTGLAVKRLGSITRFVVNGDGKRLVEEFDWSLLTKGDAIEVAGHNRYSTSDLDYPQPIMAFEDFALCHNGVVDQRPPVFWEEYGYRLSTLNDSELLYHCSYSGGEPLKRFPEASMAVCELHVQKGLRWYRNGKRPLYKVKVENGFFICSTEDIAKRSGLRGAERCLPGVIYTYDNEVPLVPMKELIPC